MRTSKPRIVISDLPTSGRTPQATAADENPFGYCTEFLLKGEKLNPEDIRKKLEKKGESLIVVGDDSAVRIHIHSLDPGNVITFATKRGTIHQTSIRNMDEQHRDFLEMQKDKSPTLDTAIVAVVAGEGLSDVFASLGVGAVVPGGQTMNPSTKDILQAVDKVNADKVIVLPNNKNIVSTAEQVHALTDKMIEVVPTRTMVQGVAALLAFDYEADIKTNSRLMGKAAEDVRTIEVTRAVRATKIGDLQIKKKQPMGLLDGEVAAVGAGFEEVIFAIMDKIDLTKSEVVTVYYGADVQQAEAEQICNSIREKYPNIQAELISGGQPHYHYIISVE